MNISQFSSISFPTFGIEINPPRGINLFGLDIRLYGILVALGMLFAICYGIKRSKEFGLKDEDIMDAVLIILPLSVICARLYYCIFSWDYFSTHLNDLLNFRKGGLAIYGGLIGAAIMIPIFCKIKKMPIFALLDITLLGTMMGQSIGRWGNFLNREAFGATTDNFMRMGLFNTITNTYEYYHPTFLYESIWNFIGFFVLQKLSRKRTYDGQIALGYTAWYGFGRMFIEGLRMDSLYMGPIRISQLVAAVTFIMATAIMIIIYRKNPDPKKMAVNLIKEVETKSKHTNNRRIKK